MAPQQARGKPPDVVMPGLKVWYVPANSRRDLRRGSRLRAMDDFLLSARVQDVVLHAAEDIAGEARGMAIEEGAVETGDYANRFDAQPGPVAVVAGNPRRTAIVTNDSDAAAPHEFGNSKRPARRTLLRAGLKFHTPKGIA